MIIFNSVYILFYVLFNSGNDEESIINQKIVGKKDDFIPEETSEDNLISDSFANDIFLALKLTKDVNPNMLNTENQLKRKKKI
jgi:hypothetical protein